MLQGDHKPFCCDLLQVEQQKILLTESKMAQQQQVIQNLNVRLQAAMGSLDAHMGTVHEAVQGMEKHMEVRARAGGHRTAGFVT